MMGDRWRLSVIQEEVENVEVTFSPTRATNRDPLSTHKNLISSGQSGESLGTLEQVNGSSDADQDIYSKVVIIPADKKLSLESESKEGVKRITEKYDSLGRNGMGLLKEYSQNASSDTDLGTSPTSIGADPSFPPPPTQDELSNAIGLDPKPLAQNAADIKSLPHPVTETIQAKPSVHTVNGRGRNPPSQPPPLPPSSVNVQREHHHRCVAQQMLLPESEVNQIEMFYRSHKTEVWVCRCIAHLHFGIARPILSTPKLGEKANKKNKNKQVLVVSDTVDQWKYVKSGIPLFLLDSGESHRIRQFHILLAERGTGFTIWRDTLNHLSGYKAMSLTCHTMHLSEDHNNMALFRFDDSSAASEFLSRFTTIASNPNDDILNLIGSKKRKDDKRRLKGKYRPPSKSTISSPCGFTHITKLDRADGVSLLRSSHSTTASPSHQVNSHMSTNVCRVHCRAQHN